MSSLVSLTHNVGFYFEMQSIIYHVTVLLKAEHFPEIHSKDEFLIIVHGELSVFTHVDFLFITHGKLYITH